MQKFVILAGILMLGLMKILPAAGAQPPPSHRIPVILDTDIGGDIDDAFALALIINSPELELLGVTTVSFDTRAKARLAAKMLWEAGGAWRRVPVYAGQASGPQSVEPQTRWAEGFSSPSLHNSGAVDFIRTEINRRPGKVTIICIGELTNVAALFHSDPSAPARIKSIALMGGSISRGYAPGSKPEPEYNIMSNPGAAETVFSSAVPILMAPLDVTAMLKLDAVSRRRLFTQIIPVTSALAILYHLWGDGDPTLNDPMIVAMLVRPGICETRQAAIEVDEKGFTRIVERTPANVTVGMHTDPKKFFELYLARVALRHDTD